MLRIPIEYYGNNTFIYNLNSDAFINMILMILLIWLLIFNINKNILNGDILILVLFGVTCIISLYTSINPNLSLTQTGNQLFIIVLYTLIYTIFTEKETMKIFYSVIISLSIVSFDTYLGYLFGEGIILKQGYQWVRVSGLLFNTEAWQSATMELYLLMSYLFFMSLRESTLFSDIKIKYKIKDLIIIMFIIGSIFLSGYRSAIILTFLIFILLIFFSGNIINKIKYLIIALIFMLLIVYAYYIIAPEGLLLIRQVFDKSYLVSLNPNISTFSLRLLFMQRYLFNFNVPSFGYGINTFGILNECGDAGSLYVYLWFSLGWIGFFIFAIFIIYNTIKIILIKDKVFIDKYVLMLIIVGLVGGISESTLLGKRGIYFFILLGISKNLKNKHDIKFKGLN